MKMVGIIFSNIYDNTLGELTKKRTVASVPFGGRYRQIDFVLSNMVNSGITTTGIITKYHYQSLMDHLGTSSEWDLDRKNGGLFIIPPFADKSTEVYKGKIEALYGALVEPALMLTAGTLALLAGHTSFARIFAEAATGDLQLTVLLVLTAYVLVKIVFTESGRVPVDDPRTHLELTMIHEVMCLDYCGTDLGMIKIAGWLKTAALSMVTAALCPHWWAAAPLAVLLTGLSVGVVESTQARNKLSRNTTFILTIAALAALVFFTGYLLQLNISIQ